ncbi:response regulator [Sphingomonas solaris]|uniref:Response regulator n=1 Tax=Alterirhizorhabdus solaris TaxID=2529389 RepID=A0A558R8M8_9SPHN|nr:response regulator [Sphingomonas solaris]TVV75751.1 response regulator [Sphingomonas solaris]
MTMSTVPYALIVDDDPIILMDACDIIEDAGFRSLEAMTGDDAKVVLAGQAQKIILLFSDVEMPGDTDGFDLAHHVADNYPWIEIVIASGRIQPAGDDMPAKASFIRKPFNDRMIHDHLREILPDGKQPEPLRHAV